ncbi:hypothetical protein GKE56_12320 [Nostocoides sp. HKS02]|nr:hypothetical protein GKE56_12320 [Tetrasphaera sp. HKS02]
MLTPCVGREEFLERLLDLTSGSRWVTLTGAPGCGKTLVARHVAARASRTAWVVAHRHPTTDALLAACLTALRAEVAPGDTPNLALKRALDGQDVLLVLDGVDHIEGLGVVLQDLVEDAAGFRLLCTATTMAGRPHETVLRLPPLPVPPTSQPLEGPPGRAVAGPCGCGRGSERRPHPARRHPASAPRVQRGTAVRRRAAGRPDRPDRGARRDTGCQPRGRPASLVRPARRGAAALVSAPRGRWPPAEPGRAGRSLERLARGGGAARVRAGPTQPRRGAFRRAVRPAAAVA